MKTPRAAAIHDLAGIGRCSLTAAIPILSAMGIQVCPFPTAVLSNQTGFPRYELVDLTDRMEAFGQCWAPWYGRFDAVCSGFLGNPRQAEITRGLVEKLRGEDTLVLVDTVLGDHGMRYPIFDEEMCSRVRELAFDADVITPNLTEACLLAGEPAEAAQDMQSRAELIQLASYLASQGPGTVVITGIRDEDQVANLAYIKEDSRCFWESSRRIGYSYSGTGDVLASILCGGLVHGLPLGEVLRTACRFLETALEETAESGSDPREGIIFDRFLGQLTELD